MLVHLPSFVDICMQVDLGSLDGGVPQILLDNTEVLGPFVELARIAVADFVRSYPRRCIMLENMLDCPRGYMLALLADKKRAHNPVADKSEDIMQGVIVDKHDTDLVTFPLDPDGMLVKIDILNIHIA